MRGKEENFLLSKNFEKAKLNSALKMPYDTYAV